MSDYVYNIVFYKTINISTKNISTCSQIEIV